MGKKGIIVLIGLAFISGVFSLSYFKRENHKNKILRIGITKHISSIPFYIAKERIESLKDESNFSFSEMTTDEAIQSFNSGDIDIVSSVPIPYICGMLLMEPGEIHAIMPCAEIKSPSLITGIVVKSDFSGEKIENLFGEIVYAPYRFLLLDLFSVLNSIDPHQNIKTKYVHVPSDNFEASLLQSDSINVALVYEPLLTTILQSGKYRLFKGNFRAELISNPYWDRSAIVKKKIFENKNEQILLFLKYYEDAISHLHNTNYESQKVVEKYFDLKHDLISHLEGYLFTHHNEIFPISSIDSIAERLVRDSVNFRKPDLMQFFPKGLYGQ